MKNSTVATYPVFTMLIQIFSTLLGVAGVNVIMQLFFSSYAAQVNWPVMFFLPMILIITRTLIDQAGSHWSPVYKGVVNIFISVIAALMLSRLFPPQ